ncbi:hypothetical protein JHK82_027066 [Glycine max]|uniref:Uncharacterized protein n=1 Tax=Glycine soja TaxID=3848 RepID=A0A445IIU2_GLYSO|nr:hypothetical protein JHK87_026953 [Glycine soja]KAG4996254.1 hypothetical protein JHK85_027693 [Glycine max]KAG5003054.1 hypothetical protein JHK86_027193 [Glycine max]KAG5126231.1 hypothetical protein JHK82_027066 [Glycine max]RZB85948.1 hypothetical protein D0Y65_026149 [Glycine soja]
MNLFWKQIHWFLVRNWYGFHLQTQICVRHLKPFKYTSYLSLGLCACLVYFVIHNFSSINNFFNYRTTPKPPGNITVTNPNYFL